MEISSTVIVIFHKVVVPWTVHLASQLKISLILEPLVSLCFFGYEVGRGELVMMTHYDLMPWAAAFPEQLLFLINIVLCARPLIFCIFYLLIRSCSLYITASFISPILLYVPIWSSVFIWVFYFSLEEIAEGFISMSECRFKLYLKKTVGERCDCNRNSRVGGRILGVHTFLLQFWELNQFDEELKVCCTRGTCHFLETVPLTITFPWKILRFLAVCCQHSCWSLHRNREGIV